MPPTLLDILSEMAGIALAFISFDIFVYALRSSLGLLSTIAGEPKVLDIPWLEGKAFKISMIPSTKLCKMIFVILLYGTPWHVDLNMSLSVCTDLSIGLHVRPLHVRVKEQAARNFLELLYQTRYLHENQ